MLEPGEKRKNIPEQDWVLSCILRNRGYSVENLVHSQHPNRVYKVVKLMSHEHAEVLIFIMHGA